VAAGVAAASAAGVAGSTIFPYTNSFNTWSFSSSYLTSSTLIPSISPKTTFSESE
jgi:hypothetical protein